MELENIAKKIRKMTLETIGHLGVGHIGGSLSIVDLLVVLYQKHMNIDPKNPLMPARDRLVVSKGHAGPAVYAMLAYTGYFPKEWLLTLNQNGTNLPSHCDMNKTPGVDMTTGSLGQGFGCAMGIAYSSKLKKDGATTYTIIGDGESQEGQIWEAAMFAAHHKLDNIIAFTDFNKLQLDGELTQICNINPLADKWRAFNWNVLEVTEGNTCDEIDKAIAEAKLLKNGKPTMIILHTVKGKGVAFAEEAYTKNHSMPITLEMLEQALLLLEPCQS